MKGLLGSVDGTAARNGDDKPPLARHAMVRPTRRWPRGSKFTGGEEESSGYSCASCHSSAAFLAKHDIPFAHPVESYKLSAHGRAVAAGREGAATCSDCHASHANYSGRDARSKSQPLEIFRRRAAHVTARSRKVYAESVHGQALSREQETLRCAPTAMASTSSGASDAQSTVNPARVSSVTCGRCHGDERINTQYNLPADRVPTFADSFHGLAARTGSQAVANCASCHGVHDIFSFRRTRVPR